MEGARGGGERASLGEGAAACHGGNTSGILVSGKMRDGPQSVCFVSGVITYILINGFQRNGEIMLLEFFDFSV